MERVFSKEKTDDWIVLEGIDGTGKSTLAKLATEQITIAYLATGRTSYMHVLEEPSGTPEGRAIAGVIDEHEWCRTSSILFYGGLVLHTLLKTIHPATQKGERVLSVRSFPSTFAYQGVDAGHITIIADMYADLIKWYPCPKIVLATCHPDTAIKRIEERDGRTVGKEEADNLRHVNERYHDMAERFDWDILDTNGSIEAATETLVGMIT